MEGAIRYTVKVTAIVERRERKGRQWAKIGSRVVGDMLGDEMGYTPEVETLVRSDQTIFEQTVDHLDMAALVSVINGLPMKAGA